MDKCFLDANNNDYEFKCAPQKLKTSISSEDYENIGYTTINDFTTGEWFKKRCLNMK